MNITLISFSEDTVCPYCSQEFANKQSMWWHIQTKKCSKLPSTTVVSGGENRADGENHQKEDEEKEQAEIIVSQLNCLYILNLRIFFEGTHHTKGSF